MFTFEKGILFIETTKAVVMRLRAESTMDENIKAIDVENATGKHVGAAIQSPGHPTVLYFEERPQPPVEVKEVPDAETTHG